MKTPAKDPYCCLSDKIRAATDGFDRGALTTYRSLRYAVRQLSREDALALIDSQIADLTGKLDAPSEVTSGLRSHEGRHDHD